jgi:outer membrane murein-binding lipoprotein Lpp
MKKTLILTIIVVSATLLCGCQEQQQLADCQEQTAKLEQTIEQQKADIAKAEKAVDNSVSMVTELLFEDAYDKKDLNDAQKEIEALKKENARLKAELSRTPEERANIRKGVEELMQLQKESAEKLIKAKEAEEAGQN